MRENSKRLPYEYTVEEKVLIGNKRYEKNCNVSAPTKVPYVSINVNKNGKVVIEHNQYHETINITLASSGVAGLECTGPAGVVLHFLAKLFEFCQKILIFIQHISFRLTNQLKK